MLNDHHISVIKSTIPLLESAGPAITMHFYARLFTHNPELKNIFNMANQKTGRQQVALFEAIAAYAKNIENLAVLSTAVERIAQKHTSFAIQANQYDVVGHHLIETLRELAADAFTPEVEEAWTQAYGFLAQIFINREAQLYEERAQNDGGWSGTRTFTVKEKNKESELVTSFVLEPEDKGQVLGFYPGQYIGLELTPVGSEYKEIRQYSLSDCPNGRTYRISVKREAEAQPDAVAGVLSNYLHDFINVGDSLGVHAPAGDFYVKDTQKPVVLVSAGVGITPMQSMLESLSRSGYTAPVYYLHACENKAQHSFAERTTALITKNNWQQKTWYNDGENLSDDIAQGTMDFSDIELPVNEGDFYLCGPIGFMQFAKKQLVVLGVQEASIHYEVFGPHNDF